MDSKKEIIMKTTISDSTGFSGKIFLKKILLNCGILSSLLYVTATILGAMQWKDYSHTSQTISELIAINAPSSPLVVPLFLTYCVLMFAFGLGVWRSSGQKHVLRIVACFIVGKEILGLAATLFAPMYMRGQATTISDSMHALLTGVGVFLCMFPAIGLGATAFGKQFRLYSIGTMLIFIVFGIMSFLEAPQLAANLPTPWLGVWERVNVFGYLLWIVVLAITLLKTEKREDSFKSTTPG
jgi:hypothetical protein